VFKADTRSAINQFRARKITLPECLTALADALMMVKPKLGPFEFLALGDMVVANNARVMGEAASRERDRLAARERRRKSKLLNQI